MVAELGVKGDRTPVANLSRQGNDPKGATVDRYVAVFGLRRASECQKQRQTQIYVTSISSKRYHHSLVISPLLTPLPLPVLQLHIQTHIETYTNRQVTKTVVRGFKSSCSSSSRDRSGDRFVYRDTMLKRRNATSCSVGQKH